MSYGSVTETFPGYNELLVLKTVSELRLLGTSSLTAMSVVMLQGRTTFDDGLGNLFIWSPTSETTDNGTTVIKPASVTVGRWLAFNRNA